MAELELCMFDPIAFWQDPDASSQPQPVKDICRPEWYIDQPFVTALVVDTLSKYASPGDRILEIGSGTGRNLAALHEVGFTNLWGVEVSKKAIDIGTKQFPIYAEMRVMYSPIERVAGDLPLFDIIFTQGCLMHLPPESEWVFEKIARKSRRILMTIENEVSGSERAWVRNYKDIFEALSWYCVEEHTCEAWPPLPEATVLRVFERTDR